MSRTYILATFLAACSVLGGCSTSVEVPDSDESAVIGGTAETGYVAVGFLLDMEQDGAVFCGATLIAPDVAVTAAHCVEPAAAKGRYVMGLGSVANDPPQPENVRRDVVEVLRHPSYVSLDDETGSPFDIAIVRLAAPVTDREPAKLGSPTTTSCEHRYVGYGRSTPGGMFSLETVWGERKSTKTCVRTQTTSELTVRGVDGGNCWGDSGGPLMIEGTNEIVAVMSRFAPLSPMDWYECEQSNTMVMIRVDANRDFLATYAPSLALP